MLNISPIPAFDDNYIWLLQREGTERVAVVDPGDEGPVLEKLEAEGLTLGAILITHKHGDHVGGVAGLLERFPEALVYGPAHEAIRHIGRPVGEGDQVDLDFLDTSFNVMEVPGHTEGHLAYHGEGMLFCGDTLFAAGCGRVFSGTHEQLHHSLQRIAALPENTLIYCAHEYTQANIGFALWVEPESAVIKARAGVIATARQQGLPTVPSLLSEELQTNPFLRVGEAPVVEAAERYAGKPLTAGEAVFTAIRTWKDREYD